MTGSAFQSQLARGVVLHAIVDSSVLDDPAIATRGKFLVILNYYCPDDPLYFVMATSNIGRFSTGGRWASEAVALDPLHYPFLTRPTTLDFTSVKAISLIDLTALNSKGLARIVGVLRAEDLKACDEVIRNSRYIEPRVLPLITPGGYF